MNVLFIGNSFTYFNCLTGMLWNQARLNGKELNVEELTTGGYYLHQYVDKEDKHGLEVTCNGGTVLFMNIQAPGKKAMDVSAYFLGNKIEIGTVLG